MQAQDSNCAYSTIWDRKLFSKIQELWGWEKGHFSGFFQMGGGRGSLTTFWFLHEVREAAHAAAYAHSPARSRPLAACSSGKP